MRLEGRVAIVTGAGRGIGRAIAEAMAEEGALVTVLARSKDEVDEVATGIRNNGGEAVSMRCDVSSEDEVTTVTREVMGRFGQVDILVNNAAINHPNTELVDLDAETFRRVLDVNLAGPYLCSRAVLPHMKERGSGKIINISSIGGRRGGVGRGAYRASKAGLINLTETLAAENRKHGINVTCVCPGAVATEMMKLVAPNRDMSKMMEPREIASVVVWLSSDDSTAVTGTSIDAFGQSNPLFG
jgi:NAD(P)-dependent dehydrogenase (short-subunit alcohol dehydrogenase family)